MSKIAGSAECNFEQLILKKIEEQNCQEKEYNRFFKEPPKILLQCLLMKSFVRHIARSCAWLSGDWPPS